MLKLSRSARFLLFLGALFIPFMPVLASEATIPNHAPIIFLWVAIMLLGAKLASFIERWGLPTVLGELIVGIILGSLGYFGFHGLDAVKTDVIINFLAQLGVVILLFQIGLESNVGSMRKLGANALLIALTGVIATFGLIYFAIPFLVEGATAMEQLFLAGAFTSTSVGISARVFRDLGQLKSKNAQLVLGAAVMDDIIGLIILAVLSAMVTSGNVDLVQTGVIFLKAFGFLIGSIVLGQLLAPQLGKMLARIHNGTGMKLTLALSFGLIFAYLAQQIELAPIIGAFAAGLVLDPVHFKGFNDPSVIKELRDDCKSLPTAERTKIEETLKHHSTRHLEEIVEPIGLFLVPIFFVLTGMNVELSTLANPAILLTAFGFAVVAILGKLAAGLAARDANKTIVGWGMVPRGEVQLIFASIGRSLDIISPEIYTVIVIVVVATTILTPIVLSQLLKKSN